jgi:hypothetical protein
MMMMMMMMMVIVMMMMMTMMMMMMMMMMMLMMMMMMMMMLMLMMMMLMMMMCVCVCVCVCACTRGRRCNVLLPARATVPRHWGTDLVGMANVCLVPVVHVPGGACDEQHPELPPLGYRRERSIHKVHRDRCSRAMRLFRRPVNALDTNSMRGHQLRSWPHPR